EVTEPGAVLRAGALYDSNRFVLQALLRRLGADVSDLGILPDSKDAVASAVRAAAAGHDLVVTSGGVSTGEEDHVRAALEGVGSLVFWRLAIKPGRPVAMGVVAGTPVIGLPGNPVAVFVTFAHVVRPLVAALAGEAYSPPPALPVVADFVYRKKEGRREYVRVALARDGQGRVVARKHPREGAGIITSLTETDGLVELPEAITSVAPGDVVGFLSYAVLR
ncbi:MAG: molybdopterin molybdotransferase MoeA, partial [Alsobacter sp.]